MSTCAGCKRNGEGLNACARCNVVYYCNRECQKSHWKLHKPACTPKEKPAIATAYADPVAEYLKLKREHDADELRKRQEQQRETQATLQNVRQQTFLWAEARRKKEYDEQAKKDADRDLAAAVKRQEEEKMKEIAKIRADNAAATKLREDREKRAAEEAAATQTAMEEARLKSCEIQRVADEAAAKKTIEDKRIADAASLKNAAKEAAAKREADERLKKELAEQRRKEASENALAVQRLKTEEKMKRANAKIGGFHSTDDLAEVKQKVSAAAKKASLQQKDGDKMGQTVRMHSEETCEPDMRDHKTTSVFFRKGVTDAFRRGLEMDRG